MIEGYATMEGTKGYFKKRKIEDANIKKNQRVLGEYRTPLEVAKDLGLTVTISSPLNAGNIKKGDHIDRLISFVTNTEGVYSAMVGCKSKEHLIQNINNI